VIHASNTRKATKIEFQIRSVSRHLGAIVKTPKPAKYFYDNFLRESQSIAHFVDGWGLDIFPCLVGGQSSHVRHCQSKGTALSPFVQASWHPGSQAYSQVSTVSWTAVASAGQWSRARHRFGFGWPDRTADPVPLRRPRAKAPSPRGTAVPCSAGAFHTRRQCHLKNIQTPAPTSWAVGWSFHWRRYNQK
jgi:hypothetical protein